MVGPKQTALGEGYFVNQKIRWHVGDEEVADMDWRIMKFLPANKQGVEAAESGSIPADLDPDKLMRRRRRATPQFFWTASTPTNCGSRSGRTGSLQHPPVPAVWADKDAPADYVVASGKGTVFSYVVHHAPKVPGRSLPFVIALVELEEGRADAR
ncbi:nucleic acid-binding protein [Mycolicibacterium fortuitum]|uniref:Nucleic acid-binding protein n=1 Tax=Mycolicibacterium fortuitum TaxID=1766 RepID=A0A378UWN3_MYCFO|nr:nucleic acid-binding protein [Mycolicibacterium fortuitum]